MGGRGRNCVYASQPTSPNSIKEKRKKERGTGEPRGQREENDLSDRERKCIIRSVVRETKKKQDKTQREGKKR